MRLPGALLTALSAASTRLLPVSATLESVSSTVCGTPSPASQLVFASSAMVPILPRSRAARYLAVGQLSPLRPPAPIDRPTADGAHWPPPAIALFVVVEI